jgi:glycosyltransferase involved in cell wall biosynthesis
VHAAEEDFGLTLVEAQAAGCPVIAYGRGGAAETILPDITGILFPEQTAESLIEAIRRFESKQSNFDPRLLRQNADLFSKFQFQEKFLRICTTRPVLVTNPKIDRVMAR